MDTTQTRCPATLHRIDEKSKLHVAFRVRGAGIGPASQASSAGAAGREKNYPTPLRLVEVESVHPRGDAPPRRAALLQAQTVVGGEKSFSVRPSSTSRCGAHAGIVAAAIPRDEGRNDAK